MRSGRRNTWVQDRFDAWKRRLAEWGLQSHLLRSAPLGERGSGPLGDRLTPWPCASTACLLTMLCWWVLAPKNGGGLEHDGDRKRARLFLDAFLLHAVGQVSEVSVFLGEFACRWPRPPSGTWPAQLFFSGAYIDITELRAKYSRMGEFGQQRLAALRDEFGTQQRLETTSFMSFCICNAALFLSLAGQLLCSLALFIDASIATGYRKGRAKSATSFR